MNRRTFTRNLALTHVGLLLQSKASPTTTRAVKGHDYGEQAANLLGWIYHPHPCGLSFVAERDNKDLTDITIRSKPFYMCARVLKTKSPYLEYALAELTEWVEKERSLLHDKFHMWAPHLWTLEYVSSDFFTAGGKKYNRWLIKWALPVTIDPNKTRALNWHNPALTPHCDLSGTKLTRLTSY